MEQQEKLIEEQPHSVLELKSDHDKIDARRQAADRKKICRARRRIRKK